MARRPSYTYMHCYSNIYILIIMAVLFFSNHAGHPHTNEFVGNVGNMRSEGSYIQQVLLNMGR